MQSYKSLQHVPRRAVAVAKELRRMGLDVVPAGAGRVEGDDPMSSDVKNVTDVAREVADLGRRARGIADNMRADIKDVNEALDVAEDISRALRSAGAELRGVLGTQTNHPPEDEGENDAK